MFARHTLSAVRRSLPICTRPARRTIHITPIAQRKKEKVVVEDLFGDEGGFEELIKSQPTSTASKTAGEPIASTSSFGSDGTVNAAAVKKEYQPQPQVRIKLSPEKRAKKFEEIIKFVKPRLGRKPEVTAPRVRNSAWVNLIGLAANEGQLKRVVDLFPGWKESGREFNDQISEDFVRRCEELSCPLLALEVFGDFSKYNLRLTLPGARQLIHSLQNQHPLEKVMAVTALYSVYQLPPISGDLISCAMVISACFKHGSNDSIVVGKALLPALHQMLNQQEPLPVSKKPLEKSLDKPRTWLRGALKRVDETLLTMNGEKTKWLEQWRIASQHIPNPSVQQSS
ncbi:hypothetical protein BDQ12DRAFT_715881 [Crucibulum laeve]|uniref:Armadillo-type protein n=1 Tax=Crucibulum laeve TaxID=68775 RepID=A0A5C3LJW8_9AGAR|nr:hypothetical protein BDQ12DRAFT_715881 [Crucibulum laeve]